MQTNTNMSGNPYITNYSEQMELYILNQLPRNPLVKLYHKVSEFNGSGKNIIENIGDELKKGYIEIDEKNKVDYCVLCLIVIGKCFRKIRELMANESEGQLDVAKNVLKYFNPKEILLSPANQLIPSFTHLAAWVRDKYPASVLENMFHSKLIWRKRSMKKLAQMVINNLLTNACTNVEEEREKHKESANKKKAKKEKKYLDKMTKWGKNPTIAVPIKRLCGVLQKFGWDELTINAIIKNNKKRDYMGNYMPKIFLYQPQHLDVDRYLTTYCTSLKELMKGKEINYLLNAQMLTVGELGAYLATHPYDILTGKKMKEIFNKANQSTYSISNDNTAKPIASWVRMLLYNQSTNTEIQKIYEGCGGQSDEELSNLEKNIVDTRNNTIPSLSKYKENNNQGKKQTNYFELMKYAAKLYNMKDTKCSALTLMDKICTKESEKDKGISNLLKTNVDNGFLSKLNAEDTIKNNIKNMQKNISEIRKNITEEKKEAIKIRAKLTNLLDTSSMVFKFFKIFNKEKNKNKEIDLSNEKTLKYIYDNNEEIKNEATRSEIKKTLRQSKTESQPKDTLGQQLGNLVDDLKDLITEINESLNKNKIKK